MKRRFPFLARLVVSRGTTTAYLTTDLTDYRVVFSVYAEDVVLVLGEQDEIDNKRQSINFFHVLKNNCLGWVTCEALEEVE